jgi:hypothetical protein
MQLPILGMTTVNQTSELPSKFALNSSFTIYSFGPFKGDQPAGTTWATGFPHTAWFDLSAYYITAYKTGSYPAITVSYKKTGVYFILTINLLFLSKIPSISGLDLTQPAPPLQATV